jgi:putative heme iron utilization protein
MSKEQTNDLPANFLAGVISHINEDHRAEMLAIAHVLAGQAWATDAALQHADKLGLDLLLTAGERTEQTRVLFDAPCKKSSDFRNATIKLIERAQKDPA